MYLDHNIPEPTNTAMISNGVLYDVNHLLGIEVFNTSAYSLEPNAPPAEIAYYLIKIASYIQALVYFERVVYIEDTKLLKSDFHLHDHLNKYTKQNPLQLLYNGGKPPFGLDLSDPDYSNLMELTESELVTKKGFQELAHSCKYYEHLKDPWGVSDFSSPFIAHYWASKQLPYDYCADPFESYVAAYDVFKMKKTSNLRKALDYIRTKRFSDFSDETVKAYDIKFVPVFLAALMESRNLHQMFQVVFQFRDEAKSIRKLMKNLDDVDAKPHQIKEIINEIEKYGRPLSRLEKKGKFFNVNFSCMFVGVSFPFLDFLRRKKTFLQKMYEAQFKHEELGDKLTEILKNSGYDVNGVDVLRCAYQFFDDVKSR